MYRKLLHHPPLRRKLASLIKRIQGLSDDTILKVGVLSRSSREVISRPKPLWTWRRRSLS